MRRIACVVLLAVLAGACGSSGHSAAPSLTLPITPRGQDTARNMADAKKQFGALVKEDPKNKFGWYNLGVIAEYEHDTTAAAADDLEAIAIDPHFEAALYNYGVLQYGAADYPAAITYLRRAVKEDARDANALWHLGIALGMRHTPAADREATRDLNAALKLDPTLVKTRTPASGSGGSGAA